MGGHCLEVVNARLWHTQAVSEIKRSIFTSPPPPSHFRKVAALWVGKEMAEAWTESCDVCSADLRTVTYLEGPEESGVRRHGQDGWVRGSVPGPELHFDSDHSKVEVGFWYGQDNASPDLNPSSPDLNPSSSDLNPSSPDLNPSSPDRNPSSPDLNPSSPDLNPTENLWAVLKREIKVKGRQYPSLNRVWEAVVDRKQKLRVKRSRN
ncbi:hypothetical protein NQZ68_015167 [Dissostichus eleginoides]|nr:hypothetical protein NQZ68_015167 [Dissostichus eleginoides]